MMRPLFEIILSFLTAFFIQGCSDRGAPVILVSPAVPDNRPIALIVHPDSGRIGTPISIYDSSFFPRRNYLVGFPGADDALVAPCDSSLTIHVFVPFGATSGSISVDLDGRIGLTQRFYVTETVDTLALSVTGYDISPPVSPADSSVIDFLGFSRTWQAEVSGDTVHFSRRYSAGEIFFDIHLVLLDSGPTQLPRLLRLWTYTKFDYPGSRTDTIRAGILKIQDWALNRVMSGRFFGKPSTHYMFNGTAAFWVDRSR